MVGAHRRRRAPTRYRPGSVFFSGGLLLCLTFGLTLAGVHDSYLTGRWVWFGVFVTADTLCAVLYFCNVQWWLQWVNQTGDYITDYRAVVSSHECDTEHDHHTGEH